MKYPEENWKRLGRWVGEARRASGIIDTADWAKLVGRSDRMLLGLERGEQVGDGTLKAVAAVLGVDVGVLYRHLVAVNHGPGPDSWTVTEPEPVGPSAQDAGYVASPGEKVPAGVSDDEVLREIRAMRAEVNKLAGLPAQVDALSERVARIEQQGS